MPEWSYTELDGCRFEFCLCHSLCKFTDFLESISIVCKMIKVILSYKVFMKNKIIEKSI